MRRIKEALFRRLVLYLHKMHAQTHSTHASILIIYMFIVGIVRRQNSHRIPQIPRTSSRMFGFLITTSTTYTHTHISARFISLQLLLATYLDVKLKAMWVLLFSRVSTVKGIFRCYCFFCCNFMLRRTHEPFDTSVQRIGWHCSSSHHHRHMHITSKHTQHTPK